MACDHVDLKQVTHNHDNHCCVKSKNMYRHGT